MCLNCDCRKIRLKYLQYCYGKYVTLGQRDQPSYILQSVLVLRSSTYVIQILHALHSLLIPIDEADKMCFNFIFKEKKFVNHLHLLQTQAIFQKSIKLIEMEISFLF